MDASTGRLTLCLRRLAAQPRTACSTNASPKRQKHVSAGAGVGLVLGCRAGAGSGAGGLRLWWPEAILLTTTRGPRLCPQRRAGPAAWRRRLPHTSVASQHSDTHPLIDARALWCDVYAPLPRGSAGAVVSGRAATCRAWAAPTCVARSSEQVAQRRPDGIVMSPGVCRRPQLSVDGVGAYDHISWHALWRTDPNQLAAGTLIQLPEHIPSTTKKIIANKVRKAD